MQGKLTHHAIRKLVACFLILACSSTLFGQTWSRIEDLRLKQFFEYHVSKIERTNELTSYKTLQDWEAARPQLRNQLFDMLGLLPLPKRTPLHAKVTGTNEHPEFTVERLHFQSMPGLYVTANLYLPKPGGDGNLIANKVDVTQTYPTVLYVCGHAKVKKGGISYGNKAHYQHHGAWFARNGYVCLIIDTVQRGEIEGFHHGTYRLNRWWWNSRGYTPAGLEAWNCMRALDYLETRSECDMQRVGVTGRSGGGIYSWWLAALDDRVQCAVPVAGITSMRNQVMDGCVEGHCDCMFMVNSHRWNFAKIAALVAPRPLLISNTDKDVIFPLEGVIDVHRQVRHIYRLYDASDQLGLQITEGPHADTQELHIHAFRWMNRFLRGQNAMVDKVAESFFAPEMLKVFPSLPTDEVNTRIDEFFVPVAEPLTRQQTLELQDRLLEQYRTQLRERCFRAWPHDAEVSNEVELQSIKFANSADPSIETGMQLSLLTFHSQPHVPLRLEVLHPRDQQLEDIQSIRLVVSRGENPPATSTNVSVDPPNNQFKGTAIATLSARPGAFGPWAGDDRKQTHIRRRFQLLGMTPDGMRVFDIRRGLQVLRKQCPNLKKLTVTAEEGAESLVLLATMFEPSVHQVRVPRLPMTHRDLPSILNLSRTLPEGMLPVVAARHNAIVVTSDSKESFGELSSLMSDPGWTGNTIKYSTN